MQQKQALGRLGLTTNRQPFASDRDAAGLQPQTIGQRQVSRRARSNWSQKNVQHAGLAHGDAARSDGRWATAYAGSATTVIPDDFLAGLQQGPAAHAFYGTLKRQQLFTIYYRLISAKRPETRQTRMVEMLAKLARGESL